MTSVSTQAHSEMPSRPLPHDSSSGHRIRPLIKEELDGVLRAMEIPFDANLVQGAICTDSLARVYGQLRGP